MGRFYKTTSIPTIDYSYKYPFEEILRASQYKQARQDKAIQDLYTAKDKLLNIDYVPGTEDEAYLKQKQAEYDKLLNQATQMDLSGGTAWLNKEMDRYVGDPRLADISYNAARVKELVAQREQLKKEGLFDEMGQPDLIELVNEQQRLSSEVGWNVMRQVPAITESYFNNLDPYITSDKRRLDDYARTLARKAVQVQDPKVLQQLRASGIDMNDPNAIIQGAEDMFLKASREYLTGPAEYDASLDGGGSGSGVASTTNSPAVLNIFENLYRGNKSTYNNEDTKNALNALETEIDISPNKSIEQKIKVLTIIPPTGKEIYLDPTIASSETPVEEIDDLLIAREMNEFYNSDVYLEYLKLEKQSTKKGNYNPYTATRITIESEADKAKKQKIKKLVEQKAKEFERRTGYYPLKDNPMEYDELYNKYKGEIDNPELAKWFMDAGSSIGGKNIKFIPKANQNVSLVNGLPYIEGNILFTLDEGKELFGNQSIFGLSPNDWEDGLEELGYSKQGDYWTVPIKLPLTDDIGSMASSYDMNNVSSGDFQKIQGRDEALLYLETQAGMEKQFKASQRRLQRANDIDIRRLTIDPNQNRTEADVLDNLVDFEELVKEGMEVLEFDDSKKESLLEDINALATRIQNNNNDQEAKEELATIKNIVYPTAAQIRNAGDQATDNVKEVSRAMIEYQLNEMGLEGYSGGRPGEDIAPDSYGLSANKTSIENPTQYKAGMSRWAQSAGLEKVNATDYSNLTWDDNVQSISDILGTKLSAPYLSQGGKEMLAAVNEYAKSKGINAQVFSMARPQVVQDILRAGGRQAAMVSEHKVGNALDTGIPMDQADEVKKYLSNLGMSVKVVPHDNHMHIELL